MKIRILAIVLISSILINLIPAQVMALDTINIPQVIGSGTREMFWQSYAYEHLGGVIPIDNTPRPVSNYVQRNVTKEGVAKFFYEPDNFIAWVDSIVGCNIYVVHYQGMRAWYPTNWDRTEVVDFKTWDLWAAVYIGHSQGPDIHVTYRYEYDVPYEVVFGHTWYYKTHESVVGIDSQGYSDTHTWAGMRTTNWNNTSTGTVHQNGKVVGVYKIDPLGEDDIVDDPNCNLANCLVPQFHNIFLPRRLFSLQFSKFLGPISPALSHLHGLWYCKALVAQG